MPTNPTKQTDPVDEARELLRAMPLHFNASDTKLLKTLADEVDQRTRALKLMVELWDAEHPDDPCGWLVLLMIAGIRQCANYALRG